MATSNRRAMIFLDGDKLLDLLNLPDTYGVMGVYANFARMGIDIMVVSDDLEEVEPGVEPPYLGGMFNQEAMTIQDKVWYRWNWSKNDQA